MITKDSGSSSWYTAFCDFCGVDVYLNDDDFKSAVQSLKEDGWKIYLSNGEWVHKCAACFKRGVAG